MSTDADDVAVVPAEVSLAMIGRLLELGRSLHHIVVDPDKPQWWGASAGLIVRVLTLADTIVYVSRLRRVSDLAILVRCLYEHVVVLAWIAGARDESRWEIWNRESLRAVCAAGNELRDLGAVEVAEHAATWLDEQLPKSAPKLLEVKQLARQADRDWERRLGLSGLSTLYANYTLVYRSGSAFAHPSALGLHHHRTVAGTATVMVVETSGDISPIIGCVFTFLAAALGVASHTVGRPDLREIKAVVSEAAAAAARRK